MNESGKHRLYQSVIRHKFRIAGVAIMVLAVIAELFISLHPYFAVADYFGFHAVFGFAVCVAMVLFARVLGLLIRRRGDYYDN